MYASADPPRTSRTHSPNSRRAQLAGLLLPLGTSIRRTRADAERLGLPVDDKPESQDMCFVEGGHYREMLRALRRCERAGRSVTTDGVLVGTHAGISQYTVGQRRGLPANIDDGPRYVMRIERRRARSSSAARTNSRRTSWWPTR